MRRVYTVTLHNVHITDSFEVSKKAFSDVLGRIRQYHPDCEVWQRSMRSLRAEWACHNAAYALGIKRERTRDVDLNVPMKWITRAGYLILGSLVWPFIK